MASTAYIELYAEDARTYRLTVQDKCRDRYDLTDWILHSTCKDSDGNILWAKVSTNPGEILVLDQTAEDTKGQALIFFIPTDSAGKVGRHTFDVRAVRPTDLPATLIKPSPWIVLEPVTSGLP